MKKMRKNDIKMVRNLTKRKQKKRGGKEEQRIEKLLNPNSFIETKMFVKHRCTEFSMENEETLEVFDARK